MNMDNNNSVEADDFEHIDETSLDDGAEQQQPQLQQQRPHCRNFLAENNQLMLNNNNSVCPSAENSCCFVENQQKSDDFRAEIDALKTENNMLLIKVDALLALNGEEKAQIDELPARLKAVELMNVKLASERDVAKNTMVEAKIMKEMMQENQSESSVLKSKLAADKDKKMEQLEKKEHKALLEQKMTALGGKVDKLKSQRAVSDANQNNRRKMPKRTEKVLMSKKLRCLQLKQPSYFESAAWPNYWDKHNEDILTGNGLFATKSGTKYTYGNVMAKFAYSTLYFEITVKNQNGCISIGVCDTAAADFIKAGTKYLGAFPGSCSFNYGGNYFYYDNAGTRLSGGLQKNASFNTNDIVGCGLLHFAGIGKNVFFATKNGTLIENPIDLPSNAFFPSISLHGKGTRVEANFGTDLANKPFKYKIAEHKF